MAGNYYQRSPRLDQHEPQPRSAHLASTGAATQSIRPLPTPSSSGHRQPNSNPSFDHAPSSSSSRNPSPFLNRDDGGAAVAGPSQGRRAASEMQSQRERENAYGAVRSGSQTVSRRRIIYNQIADCIWPSSFPQICSNPAFEQRHHRVFRRDLQLYPLDTLRLDR